MKSINELNWLSTNEMLRAQTKAMIITKLLSEYQFYPDPEDWDEAERWADEILTRSGL